MSCFQAVGICGGWLEVFALSIVIFHPVSCKKSPTCSERVVHPKGAQPHLHLN